ncbi:MAG: hypothetical protein K2Z81_21560, partial [Cyanobacteria bacterium]|nr:hypothetical protein [Cyanobacteriota bacterium]
IRPPSDPSKVESVADPAKTEPTETQAASAKVVTPVPESLAEGGTTPRAIPAKEETHMAVGTAVASTSTAQPAAETSPAASTAPKSQPHSSPEGETVVPENLEGSTSQPPASDKTEPRTVTPGHAVASEPSPPKAEASEIPKQSDDEPFLSDRERRITLENEIMTAQAEAVLSGALPLSPVTKAEWASSAVHTVMEEAIQVQDELQARQAMIQSIRKLLQPKAELMSRQDLHRAARELKDVFPYNFDAWRLHADILLHAIEQLHTRNLQPDENFTLLTIPLREDDLRDAAEEALRQCAHYADSDEKRIQLIDEANRVRKLTWF